MDGEIHKDATCCTQSRDWKYKDRLGRKLDLCIIFMVCHCGRKEGNPFATFEQDQSLDMGECVDPHLHDKGCYYNRLPIFSTETGRLTFKFECVCYCRKESRQYIR